MTSGRVAVVGAGVAGLAAARRLGDAGLDVVVFDKARGVGGRTATRRREADAFDHGAQYFTSRTASFCRQVDDWRRRGVVAEWGAPVVVLQDGEVVGARGDTVRFVGVPGMSALARDLARGLRVECGRRIARIERASAGSGWALVDEQGRASRGFDAVAVATPAPQAAPLLAAAPQLAARVRAVPMLACHAAMLTFPEPLDVDFGGAFVSRSPLAWIARNSSKPGRPVGESWVLHSSPDWSAAHLEQPGDEVATSLAQAFAAALGRKLPHPKTLVAHRWLLARSEEPLGPPEPWDAEARIGVCGDWIRGARVEDAFTSGEELARRVLGEAAPAHEV